ncbi:glutamine-dependent NAD(+) synthetase [Boothiomyces macroporosus]|uniref:Glutamine-dependent NAD(+) synthetase n=1 Tax=Boothiomyces macroporosus TaxID=261099 RepID=A0AAD5YAD3_9FUNG|nr:glutamine-dependent NAD(+) synthetase [Boothiomyces macroporosus]
MKITISTCALNQWALDFTGNLKRTRESFRIAKEQGSTFRLGPELEITGYGCNDHFLEQDTITHSFEVLAELLQSPECQNILGDVGMPVIHGGVRYNCRVIFYNKEILLIRPKKFLANDGNYREMRWFTPWMKPNVVEEFKLPSVIRQIIGQETVPIGDGIISTANTSIGTELCEELFTPARRVDLIREATLKCGGVYLYANQQGCDGERVYYDGSALIILNGKILAQSSQFSLNDVEVISATIDLDEIKSFRGGIMSRGMQAAQSDPIPKIHTKIHLETKVGQFTDPISIKYLTPSQEIQYGPACWLWDYLRRSKQCGFFLPLSGGIDSCSTALIVYSMCEMVYKKAVVEKVLSDIRKVVGNEEFIPSSPQEICGLIFHTCYMGTENSGAETRKRSKDLALKIGSYHLDVNIDGIVKSFLFLFETVTQKKPVFKVYGGSATENLALQNIQARSRMVLAYLFAQLLLWTRGRNGSLLVLGSSNVDETYIFTDSSLRGYLTKYDCSSADLNPIGGISKVDLIEFIKHMQKQPGFALLSEFIEAPPTAELEPITADYVQTDEVDMGMTYSELSTFGLLRKINKLGPYSMFKRLLSDWGSFLSPVEVTRSNIKIAAKVKRFFFYYGINRHKTTVLPPSYHMSSYSPDDNRFDLRQFLYEGWSWQFNKIDKTLK